MGDYSRVTEVATRIANQLPSEGQSAAFRDFVWRFVNVLAKVMEVVGVKPSYSQTTSKVKQAVFQRQYK